MAKPQHEPQKPAASPFERFLKAESKLKAAIAAIARKYSSSNYMVNAMAAVGDNDGYQEAKKDKQQHADALLVKVAEVHLYRHSLRKPRGEAKRAFANADATTLKPLFNAVAQIAETDSAAEILNKLRTAYAPEERRDWTKFSV